MSGKIDILFSSYKCLAFIHKDIVAGLSIIKTLWQVEHTLLNIKHLKALLIKKSVEKVLLDLILIRQEAR